MARTVDDGVDYGGLYEGFRRGDRHAAAQLFALCNGRLYQRFIGRGCDPETACDLTQEVWARLFSTGAPGRFQGNFVHEKNKVARGILIDHLRANDGNPLRVSRSFDDDEDAESAALARQLTDQGSTGKNPADRVLEQERTEAFKTCFRQLPKEQRDALHLVYFDRHEYSYEEAAAVLGAGVETLQSRIRYAKKSLRRCLAALFPPESS